MDINCAPSFAPSAAFAIIASRFAINSSDEFARAIGLPRAPLDVASLGEGMRRRLLGNATSSNATNANNATNVVEGSDAAEDSAGVVSSCVDGDLQLGALLLRQPALRHWLTC